jgi:hypothetical protein
MKTVIVSGAAGDVAPHTRLSRLRRLTDRTVVVTGIGALAAVLLTASLLVATHFDP